MMRTLNMDGDRQADLTVHGGAEKAVYAYPSKHYVYWRQELPDEELPWGAFGENLTVEGLSETGVTDLKYELASRKDKAGRAPADGDRCIRGKVSGAGVVMTLLSTSEENLDSLLCLIKRTSTSG